MPYLRDFQAFRVRICRVKKHPPRLHLDTNNRNSKGGVTFIWGFTPPYDFYPMRQFSTPPLYPSAHPFYPMRYPSYSAPRKRGSFYNKCNSLLPAQPFQSIIFPTGTPQSRKTPSAFDIRGEICYNKSTKGNTADRRSAQIKDTYKKVTLPLDGAVTFLCDLCRQSGLTQ